MKIILVVFGIAIVLILVLAFLWIRAMKQKA